MRTGTAWSRVVVGLVKAGFSSRRSSSAAALTGSVGFEVGISRLAVVVGHMCQTRSFVGRRHAMTLSTGARYSAVRTGTGTVTVGGGNP